MRHGGLNSWHGGETIKINRSFRGVLISLPSRALIYPAEHQPTLTCMSLLASPPLVTLVLLLEHSPSAGFWSCSPICILHYGTLKKDIKCDIVLEHHTGCRRVFGCCHSGLVPPWCGCNFTVFSFRLRLQVEIL